MNARMERAGDRSLLLRFGREIGAGFHAQVRQLFASLVESPLPGATNLHPAYASLAVDFDPFATAYEELESALRARLDAVPEEPPRGWRRIEIPVCYGGEFGPDLEAVAAHCGLSARQVVARHAGCEYLVYFLGFSPGFPYLGGLDPALCVPRLASPRKSVPAGSVAIGGAQTGVYPLASPGGWRVIGRTPARLFDPARPPYALLAMGDRVRFLPVPAREFGP